MHHCETTSALLILWQMPATTVDTPLARGSLPGEPTLMIAGIVTTNVNDCVTVYSQFDDILSLNRVHARYYAVIGRAGWRDVAGHQARWSCRAPVARVSRLRGSRFKLRLVRDNRKISRQVTPLPGVAASSPSCALAGVRRTLCVLAGWAWADRFFASATQNDGGDDRIRTGEWGFCRPLPYHLATSPSMPILA